MYTMKKSHRAKRERDRKKRDEKLLKCVDGAVFTKHAIARANERSVSKNDIRIQGELKGIIRNYS